MNPGHLDLSRGLLAVKQTDASIEPTSPASQPSRLLKPQALQNLLKARLVSNRSEERLDRNERRHVKPTIPLRHGRWSGGYLGIHIDASRQNVLSSFTTRAVSPQSPYP